MTISLNSLLGGTFVGPAGLSGLSGYSGYSGSSGFSGYSGRSGISGWSGYSGRSGYSGYSGALNQWSVKTSNYTAVNGDRLVADTSGGTFTITLPATPSTGTSVQISDGSNWASTNLTVGRNGSTIEGSASNLTLDVEGGAVELVYNGTTWKVYILLQYSKVVTLAGSQTLTNKTLEAVILNNGFTEEVYTITDGAGVDLDPDNGSVQLWTLGASRSPTASSFAAGQSMTLMIDDGSGFSITWPTITWVGGSPPVLASSGYNIVSLWKVSTTLYGTFVGVA